VTHSGVFYYLLDFTIHYSKFTIPPQAAGGVFYYLLLNTDRHGWLAACGGSSS